MASYLAIIVEEVTDSALAKTKGSVKRNDILLLIGELIYYIYYVYECVGLLLRTHCVELHVLCVEFISLFIVS